jgi:hypothetical protein
MNGGAPIVGTDVPDQRRLRSTSIRDIDEFIEFLTRLEDVFGPIARPPEITTGEWFLL